MSELQQALKSKVKDGNLNLPVLSTVCTQVLQMVNDPDSSAQQLAQTIQSDQAFASHIMRIANSPAYAGITPVQTLQQAIAQQGIRQIGQIALSISVKEAVFDLSGSTGAYLKKLWKEAAICAAWAKEICRVARFNTEVAFLCGLLFQIGKPVLLNWLQEISNSDMDLSDGSEALNLLERFDRTIGARVATEWKLPPAVIETIQFIDEPESATKAKDEIMAVSAARHLVGVSYDADLMDEDTSELLVEVIQSTPIFGELNFYEDDIEKLLGRTSNVSDLVASMSL